MLFKKRKLRIFETSTFFKSIFSFLSLLSILIISLYALFQIDISKNKDIDFKKIALVFSSLILVWYGGGILNYNLHISKNDRLISYLMSILINGYIIFFIFENVNNEFTTWKDTINLSYWAMPLFCVDVLWKILISFSEYKTRPFFIKKFVAKLIINIVIYILIMLLWYTIQEYILKDNNYDYLEPKNIAVWVSATWLVIMAILTQIYISVKLRWYGVKEVSVSIKNASWNIFIWLSSIIIWAIYNFDYSHWEIEELILSGIALFLGIMIIIAIILKYKKHKDRLLLYISTLSFFIVSMSSFIIYNFDDLNQTGAIVILGGFILLFEFSIIMVTSKMPKFYMKINSLISLIVATEVVLILIQNHFLGDINLPIISDAMSATTLALSTILVIILIMSQLLIAFGINRNINKMILVTKKPNKKINMKGALNV